MRRELRYPTFWDATCGASVLVVLVACSVMLTVGGAYYAFLGDLRELAPLTWWQLGIREGSLLAVLPAGVLLRCGLLRGSLKASRYWLFLVALSFAFVGARWWLSWPMHDIALLCGGHGRWGCHERSGVDAEYVIRDETLPMFLFAPAFLLVAVHGIRRRFKGQQNTASQRASCGCRPADPLGSGAILDP